jgi:hypothetical protein
MPSPVPAPVARVPHHHKPLQRRKGFKKQKKHGNAKCVKVKKKRGGARLDAQPPTIRAPKNTSEPTPTSALHRVSKPK